MDGHQVSNWFPLEKSKNMLDEGIAGVYLIGITLSNFIPPQVVYIGSSKNLKYRLAQHTMHNSIPTLLWDLYRVIPQRFFFVQFIFIKEKQDYTKIENDLIANTWGTLNTLKRDDESLAVGNERAKDTLQEILRTYENQMKRERVEYN